MNILMVYYLTCMERGYHKIEVEVVFHFANGWQVCTFATVAAADECHFQGIHNLLL